MDTTRVCARLAGALLLSATATSLIDRALIAPIVNGPDYLAAATAHDARVVAGAFFQVVTGMTCAGIAVVFYKVLRGRTPGLAIGSVVFRTIEGTFVLIAALGNLLVVALAQQAAAAGLDPGSAARVTGDLLRTWSQRASEIGILSFYLGGTLYYWAFLRTSLLPRWLPVWGLAGTALGFVAAVFTFCGAIALFSPVQVACNVPLAVNEIVLAIWLLTAGFASSSSPAPASLPAPESVPEGSHAGPLAGAVTDRA